MDSVTGTGTILDNDQPSVVSVEPGAPGISDDSVVEGNPLVYTVTLSEAPKSDATYPFSLGGDATAGSDYNTPPSFSNGVTYDPVTGTITVPAGVKDFTVTVNTIDDSVVENPETVSVTVDSVTGTGTILDNDVPVVSIAVEPSSVDEDGNINLVYTVSLDKVSTEDTMITLSIDGTATSGTDYTGAVTSVTIPAGQTSATVTINPTPDNVYEGDETVIIKVEAGSDYSVSPTAHTATGTIIDNDKIVEINVDPNGNGNPVVYEAGLPSGTDAAATSEQAIGETFTISTTDGVSNVSVGGTSMTLAQLKAASAGSPISINTGEGTITITGYSSADGDKSATVTYTYTLNAAQTHATANGNNTLIDSVPIVVNSGLTTQGSATLNVTIVDDVPVAQSFTAYLTEAKTVIPSETDLSTWNLLDADGIPGGANAISVASGNVFTGQVSDRNGSSTSTSAVYGADGAGTVVFTQADIDALSNYGTFTTAADGTWTFTLDNTKKAVQELGAGDLKTITVGYTITDKDGDVSASQVNIQIKGQNDPYYATAVRPVVNELVGTASATAAGTYTISSGSGVNLDDPIILSKSGAQPDSLVTGVDIRNASATNPIVFNLTHGYITVTGIELSTPINGVSYQAVVKYTYTYTGGPITADISDGGQFYYSDNDSGGSTSTGFNPLILNLPDLLPTIAASAVSVSEEGLSNGIADTIGTTDTTDSATASGTMAVTNATSVVFDTTGQPTTIGGTAVTWSGAGTNTLVAKDSTGATVLTATINNTGAYTVTLNKAISHPIAGSTPETAEDVASIVLKVKADDNNPSTAAAVADLTVSIEDDMPAVAQGTQNVAFKSSDTNLAFILDLSYSMRQVDAGTGKSKFQLLQEAVVNLINTYENLGEVRVQFTTFGDDGGYQNYWMTASEAIAFVTTLTYNNGETNYDAALASAMEGFASPGKLTGAQNLAYFLTDGAPNRGQGSESTFTGTINSGTTDSGIQLGEEALWQNFLTANQINAFAFGMGSLVVSATQANLDPIAYNGVTATNTSGVVVTDLSQLSTLLQNTVTTSSQTFNLLKGSDSNSTTYGFGADGGYIADVVIDGTTYKFNASIRTLTVTGTDRKTSYDSATGVLTVTTLKGGVLSVDFDTGDYTYKPTSASANYQEQVSFSVIDKDGDTVAGNQTLDVYRLKANSDKVLTNDVDGAVVIPAAVLLANDVLSGTSASISSTTAIVGGSVSGTSAITVGLSGSQTRATPTIVENAIDAGYPTNQAETFNINGTAAKAEDFTDRRLWGISSTGVATLQFSGLADNYNSTYRDSDWMKVYLNVGDTLSVDLNGATGVTGTIYSSNGTTSVASITIATNGTYTATTAGEYYIEVKGFYDNSAYTADLSITPNSSTKYAEFNYVLSEGGLTDNAFVQVTTASGTTITGTAANETLIGTDNEADILNGGAGNDVLYGGTGNDTLTGGAGADKFVFASALNSLTNVDTITDFVSGTDKLVLDDSVFAGLTAGSDLTNFVSSSNPAATSAAATVLYNTSTGALYYDADGNGAGAAVQFATLSGHPTLLATDFIIL